MENAIKIDRIDTRHGVIKIEGGIHGEEFVVLHLWSMSTDGWEEMDLRGSWAETIFKECNDIIIDRIIEKYGSIAGQITRVVGL